MEHPIPDGTIIAIKSRECAKSAIDEIMPYAIFQ